jgi:hypothetical protein
MNKKTPLSEFAVNLLRGLAESGPRFRGKMNPQTLRRLESDGLIAVSGASTVGVTPAGLTLLKSVKIKRARSAEEE